MKFLDFYLDLYEIDLNNLKSLDEIDKSVLMNNTDSKRIKRAIEELRVRPPNVKILEDNVERLEYNFKAYPSKEFRNHWGYCDHKGDDILEMFCDCKDFFFRLYAPLVKKELAKWDVPDKYDKRNKDLNKKPFPSGYDGIQPHNREWTKITNPSGKLFVCKHLYALISSYI